MFFTDSTHSCMKWSSKPQKRAALQQVKAGQELVAETASLAVEGDIATSIRPKRDGSRKAGNGQRTKSALFPEACRRRHSRGG
jgi:hypothetical protein